MNNLPQINSDHAALRAARHDGVALCTLIGLEGSFSRRVGAQLAVTENGIAAGSLADGCLENQLVHEAAEARKQGTVRVLRYGAGSPQIDFRLPCGSGVDILIDPAPDRAAIAAAIARLDARQATKLPLALPPGSPDALLAVRHYIPEMRLALFGEGPELDNLAALANACGIQSQRFGKDEPGRLALGQAPEGAQVDAWTAIVLLFHDHEWEAAILEWALGTDAFHIGAQGGRTAREERLALLAARGLGSAELKRIRSPVGFIGHARDPGVLALSVLAEVVGDYEQLHPHR